MMPLKLRVALGSSVEHLLPPLTTIGSPIPGEKIGATKTICSMHYCPIANQELRMDALAVINVIVGNMFQ